MRSWGSERIGGRVYRDHDDVETSPIHAPISQREGPICTATALPPRSAVFSSHGTAASAESNCFGRIATARTPGKCACDAGVRRDCVTGTCRGPSRQPRSLPCVTKRIVVAKPQFEAPGVSHGSLPVGLMPCPSDIALVRCLASSAVAKGPSLAPSRVVKYHFPSTTKYRSLRKTWSSFGSDSRFMVACQGAVAPSVTQLSIAYRRRISATRMITRMMDRSETSLSVARAMIDAWRSLDWNRVASLFSEDGVLQIVPLNRQGDGPRSRCISIRWRPESSGSTSDQASQCGRSHRVVRAFGRIRLQRPQWRAFLLSG